MNHAWHRRMNFRTRTAAVLASLMVAVSACGDGDLAEEDPEGAVAKADFEQALESGAIDLVDSNGDLAEQPDISEAAPSNMCLFSGATCLWGGTLTALSCTAAIVELGINAVADGLCAEAVSSWAGPAIGGCGMMVQNCVHSEPATVYITPTKGNATGNNTKRFCHTGMRVTSIKAWSRNGRVGRIEATCADGQKLTFGRNDHGSSAVMDCVSPYLTQGFQVRTGSQVDALGLICDRVARNNPEDNDQYTGMFGGNGGSLSELRCTEGKYVYGIETWHDGSGIARRSYLNGIRLHCL